MTDREAKQTSKPNVVPYIQESHSLPTEVGDLQLFLQLNHVGQRFDPHFHTSNVEVCFIVLHEGVLLLNNIIVIIFNITIVTIVSCTVKTITTTIIIIIINIFMTKSIIHIQVIIINSSSNSGRLIIFVVKILTKTTFIFISCISSTVSTKKLHL